MMSSKTIFDIALSATTDTKVLKRQQECRDARTFLIGKGYHVPTASESHPNFAVWVYAPKSVFEEVEKRELSLSYRKAAIESMTTFLEDYGFEVRNTCDIYSGSSDFWAIIFVPKGWETPPYI